MPRNAAAYDEDLFAWTQEQAELLRSGELSLLDTLNLAEEIESMGKSLRRELRSRLIVLLAHLLKWQHQPNFRSKSWSATATEQRRQIEYLLKDSPSLGPVLMQELEVLYGEAREKAAHETGFAVGVFPSECPFTPDLILDRGFMPDGEGAAHGPRSHRARH